MGGPSATRVVLKEDHQILKVDLIIFNIYGFKQSPVVKRGFCVLSIFTLKYFAT
jgi:hypothetical protein